MAITMEMIDVLERNISQLENSRNDKKLLAKATRLLRTPNLIKELTASEMFLVDDSFSMEPVAICENISLGLPVCSKGEGKFCYCKKVCENQTELNGSGHMTPEARHLMHKKQDRVINEKREEYKEELAEFERMMDMYDYDEMMKEVLGK